MPADVAEWRATEFASQDLATNLHRAAAIDLSNRPELWPAIPANGLVRDLLAARTQSVAPSIRLSSSAGQLAVLAVLVEMAERRGSKGVRWRNCSLEAAARIMSQSAPELCGGHLVELAIQLPALNNARSALAALDDADLARAAGRVMESAISCYWLFEEGGRGPQRTWNPWVAKQQGCFFTPQFVSQYIAKQALRRNDLPILDPAVGAGALLIEAFLELEPELGPDEALRRVHGVDINPGLAELTSLVLGFLSQQWTDGRPTILGSQIITGDSLLAQLNGNESWGTWFSGVFAGGGFGAVLMNPPYGQLKVNQSTLPARSSDSRAAELIRQKALAEARANATFVASALKSHPDYRFAHGGVPDLPRFFIERALSLLRKDGLFACIVPSTFLADHRSREFRRYLIEDHNLKEINLFPEDARMFPDVNQPTCVLLAEAGTKTSKVRMRRSVRSAAELRKQPDATIDRHLIKTIDPEELRIPNCTSGELGTLRQMHQHPRLADHNWIVNLRGEFDLTINSKHLRSKRHGRKLIRGCHIERYRSDLDSNKDGWVANAFMQEELSSQKARFIDRSRIVIRQCSYLKKHRRISATVIQAGWIVANSCNFLTVNEPTDGCLDRDKAQLFLLGVLNSAIIDWRFRTTSSTNHVGNYELAALPIPIPDDRPEVEVVIASAKRLLQNPSDSAADHSLELAVRALYGLPAQD